jgi:hypothetical protein
MRCYQIDIEYAPLPISLRIAESGRTPHDALRAALANKRLPTHFDRRGFEWLPRYWNGDPRHEPEIHPIQLGQFNFVIRLRVRGKTRERYAIVAPASMSRVQP